MLVFKQRRAEQSRNKEQKADWSFQIWQGKGDRTERKKNYCLANIRLLQFTLHKD
jgi:hypothetical protein